MYFNLLDSWLIKTKLVKALEKVVKKILLNRISANQLTIIGLIVGLLSAFFIFLSMLIVNSQLIFITISLILMTISFFIDTLDGSLARLEGSTIFGGILDIFCDRIVEISIIISLISTNYSELGWPGIFLLSSIILCITMFLLTGGLVENEKSSKNQSRDEKVIQYRRGLIERSETFIFLFLIVLLIPIRVILIACFAILVFITAFLRLRDAKNLFKN